VVKKEKEVKWPRTNAKKEAVLTAIKTKRSR